MLGLYPSTQSPPAPQAIFGSERSRRGAELKAVAARSRNQGGSKGAKVGLRGYAG